MKVGWVGLGLMGLPMAERLVAAGHDVAVTTRRRPTAEPVLAAGATWADDPARCAAGRDVVFCMLPEPQVVWDVVTGDGGLLAGLAPGSVLVDMSTSGVEIAQAVAEAAAGAGVAALDAPVSGGPPAARAGTLAIMIGGDEEAFARVRPALETLGDPVLFGPAGSGQRAKLVNQVLIAGTMAGIAEAFTLAEEHQLPTELLFETVRSGMAGSSLLEFAWPRLTSGDLAPGFKVSHFVKDLRLVLAEAERASRPLPATELVLRLYQQTVDVLGPDVGTQALAAALKHPLDRQEP